MCCGLKDSPDSGKTAVGTTWLMESETTVFQSTRTDGLSAKKRAGGP